MASILGLRTTIYFGEKCCKELGIRLKKDNISKVMLVYGGGSIFKNSVYSDVVNSLRLNSIAFVEYKGVKPNPDSIHTYNGALFSRKNKVDAIIAVGGGSVIDAAKVMATLSTNTMYKDCWSYVQEPNKVKNKAIPVYSVVTTAGTASENNGGSVITNSLTKEKYSCWNASAIPVASFLDPTYLYSVSPWHTASGIFDCFSHLLEQYYDTPSFEWTKQYIFANLKTLIKYAVIAVREPKNYEAKANIQITTAMSLNGIASFESSTDWKVHSIEHSISALWDVTHGAGLALITPVYIEHRSKKEKSFLNQTLELAKEIFNVNTLEKFLTKLRKFIHDIGLPQKFTDFSEIKKVSSKDRQYIYNHTINPKFKRSAVLDKNSLSVIKSVINAIPE